MTRPSLDWHRGTFPQCHSHGWEVAAMWLTAKLAEETGELARAVIGAAEPRPGRGDIVAEAGNVLNVLQTLEELLDEAGVIRVPFAAAADAERARLHTEPEPFSGALAERKTP